MSNLSGGQVLFLIGLIVVVGIPLVSILIYGIVLLYQKAKYRAWRDAVHDALKNSKEDKK